MVIADVRVIRVEGNTTDPGRVYDNKNAKRISPTDIHPGFRKAEGHIKVSFVANGDGSFHISHQFLEIETSDGLIGRAGPISNPGPVFYLITQLRPFLIGKDPWDLERLWDLMYRSMIDARKGDPMQAISYVDIALWDLRCKYLNLPLYALLGGKTRERVRAYANATGFSQDLEQIPGAVREIRAAGYTGLKWPVLYGPANGEEGMRRTVEIVRALREAGGEDMAIMLDVWSGWDVDYTKRISERLKDFSITWLEEPVLPDLLNSYSGLNRSSAIPISGGEHEYTRWGFFELLRHGACSVYQPDPAWSGGITEVLKILAVISAFDSTASLHNSIPPLGAHISCAFGANLIPWAEYLLLIGEASQYFYRYPCRPINGEFHLPEQTGVGVELDENKIEKTTLVRF